jgi:hypothetical protein
MLNKRVIEVDDDEAEKIIAATRHKELTGSLKGIATLLNKPEKEDKAVADAIKASTEATKGLIQAVKDMPQPEKPEVNVSISQQEIVNSLKGICKEICDSNERVIDAINNKQIVDSFDITQKDNWNTANRTVKVIYKPASQITIKK